MENIRNERIERANKPATPIESQDATQIAELGNTIGRLCNTDEYVLIVKNDDGADFTYVIDGTSLYE